MDEVTTSKISPNFAITNVESYPVQFDQYLSEVPTAVKATVLTPRIQPTRKTPAQNINRSAVIGSFWLNPPHREPIIRIATIYKALYNLAFNYDRTHYDSFFNAYPELLIRSTSEEMDEFPTTADLKHNIKQYCKRVAHDLYYYEIGYANYLAALLNMLALTRYEGATPFKELASHFRWSRINSYTGNFQKWWAPVGLVEYMTAKTAFAAGKTTYGADILAIPIWVTDIFSSRGAQTPEWQNAFTIDTTDKGSTIYGGKDVPSTFRTLLVNEYRIYSQYGHAGRGRLPPNSPYIENGETVWVKNDATPTQAGVYMANRHGFGPGFKAPDTVPYANATWDNIRDNFWNAYAYWESWLTQNFAHYKDPNSDFVELFTNQIKVLEKGKVVRDLLNVVRSNKNYDVIDLLQRMTYKGDNKPQTSGFVRLSLPLSDTTQNDPSFKQDLVFLENFERYDVDLELTSEILQDAEKWPSLTPNTVQIPDSSISGDSTVYPLVPDAHVPFGLYMGDDKTKAASLSGPVATWFDLACTASLTPEDTNLTAIGVTAKYAEDFIKSADGIIFEEEPSKVYIPNARLIDNTDIYQCGFNVLISTQNTDSEWDKFYRSASNFAASTNAVDAIDNPGIFTGSTHVPRYPAVLTSNKEGVDFSLHTSETKYLESIGHALIFVGQGILNHPWLMRSYKQSGNMIASLDLEYYDGANDANKSTIQKFYATGKTGSDVTDTSVCKLISSAHTWAGFTQPNAADTAVGDQLNGVTKSATIIDAIYDMNAKSANVVTMAFNPAYGDVPLAMMINPLDDLSDAQPPVTGETYVGDSNDYGSISLSLLGVNNPEGLFDIQTGEMTLRSYQPGPRNRLAAFIESFAFRPVTGVLGLVRPSGKDHVGRITLAGASSWILALMSKVTVSFPGIEDLQAFWQHVSSSKLELDAPSPSSSTMPENSLIAEPRSPNSSVNDSHSNNRRANRDSSPAVNPRSTVGSERSVGNTRGAESFRKRKFSHGKSSSSGKTGQKPFANSDKSNHKDEESIIYNMNGSSGSTGLSVSRSDVSSKEIDKEFRKKAASSSSREGDTVALI